MLGPLGDRRAVGRPGHGLLRGRGRGRHRGGRRLHLERRGRYRPGRGGRGRLRLRPRSGGEWAGEWASEPAEAEAARAAESASGRLRRRGRRWGRGRGGGRLRRARRGRRWRAVVCPVSCVAAASGVAPVSVVVSVSVAAALPAGRPVAVMSATPAACGRTASGGRDQPDGGRAVPGVDRCVGAAISHGRRGGQRRPQQDRDHQQASGTGSVHPGSMGSRAPAHAGLGRGSPERVERRP